MFQPRVLVTVNYPDGKAKRVRAFRAYAGQNRCTWIDMHGVRHYVLLRHGFVVNIVNL